MNTKHLERRKQPDRRLKFGVKERRRIFRAEKIQASLDLVFGKVSEFQRFNPMRGY